MRAFAAAEEPHLALICRPELAKPPECEIVFALGTFGRYGREGRNRRILNDGDDPLMGLGGSLEQRVILGGLDISALSALQLPT